MSAQKQKPIAFAREGLFAHCAERNCGIRLERLERLDWNGLNVFNASAGGHAWRLIPNFSMRDLRLLGLMPRISAAPFLP